MKTIEFDLERTINAPIDQVFARLIDIEGHDDWMPESGSIRHRSRQTSPGEPAVGTTYEDETSRGVLPGEIAELEAPTKVVYHWWQTSKGGKLRAEGWPGYALEPAGDNATRVRHHAKLNTYGVYELLTPLFRHFAMKERTVTIDALRASFQNHPAG
jgi:uncharacterized protein YndB with AHSA1/START domain